jgi:hypothetical protein
MAVAAGVGVWDKKAHRQQTTDRGYPQAPSTWEAQTVRTCLRLRPMAVRYKLPAGPEFIRVGNSGYVFNGFEFSSGLTECLFKISRNAIFVRGEARILFLAHIAEAGQNLAVDLFLILEDPD